MQKMKIRWNVFETNSSSTHSLQIAPKTVNDARDEVYARIRDQYKNFHDDNYFDPEDYIKDGVFYLKGFRIDDGEELGNVYYIITNWIAKIQYMAMFIYNYIYYFSDYDKETTRYYNRWDGSEKKYAEKTEVYQWFKGEVKRYASIHNIEIHDVIFDIEYDTYIENVEGCKNPIEGNGDIDIEDIKTMFELIMDDSYVLTYRDEAYSPYNRPQVIEL